MLLSNSKPKIVFVTREGLLRALRIFVTITSFKNICASMTSTTIIGTEITVSVPNLDALNLLLFDCPNKSHLNDRRHK